MAHEHGTARGIHDHGAGESWDEHASTYAQKADELEPGLRTTTEALLDAVHAGPGVRLLDLACGPGHATAAAHARGATVLGIDRSTGMIEQARQRFPSVSFALGDMTSPPAGPWDAIICRFGAHHVDPAWLRAAFRVLRSGGRIALAENEPLGPHDHGGKVRSSEWKRRLEEAGFVGISAQVLSVRLPTPGAAPGDQLAETPACLVTATKA